MLGESLWKISKRCCGAGLQNTTVCISMYGILHCNTIIAPGRTVVQYITYGRTIVQHITYIPQNPSLKLPTLRATLLATPVATLLLHSLSAWLHLSSRQAAMSATL